MLLAPAGTENKLSKFKSKNLQSDVAMRRKTSAVNALGALVAESVFACSAHSSSTVSGWPQPPVRTALHVGAGQGQRPRAVAHQPDASPKNGARRDSRRAQDPTCRALALEPP